MAAERHARSFLAFAVVGMAGFCIDATMLQALATGFGWGPVQARTVSFPCAVTVTWLLNRRYVFAGRAAWPTGPAYVLYLVGQVVGALLNVGVFVLLVTAIPTIADRPVLALAQAAAVALVFNYAWASRLVFGLRDCVHSGRPS